MRNTPLVAALAALALTACGAAKPGAPKNLLLVGVDTLRADALGAYGDDRRVTPALDELARSAWVLEELTAPSPWTLPSFASLLTGLHPETHGAGRRLVRAPRPRDSRYSRLDPRLPTLAAVLAGAGYETAAIYSNPFLSPAFGLERGFETYRGLPPETRAAAAAGMAARWIARHRDRPWFLFLHLLDPHTPYAPPPSFCATVARRLASPPDGLGCEVERLPGRGESDPDRRRWAEALYLAEVAAADAAVGDLLAALDETGEGAETFVLVTSDHGEELWERSGARPARGYAEADHGHTLYRELVHVPGLLAGPGLGAGRLGEPVELADLPVTLLALMGLAAPPGAEGRDLSRLFAGGEAAGLVEPLRLGGALLYGDDRRSARRGRYKLIEGEGDGATGIELYDLAADPGETRDLAGGRPELVTAMRAMAAEEREARGKRRQALLAGEPVDEAADLDARHLRRLQALGYL